MIHHLLITLFFTVVFLSGCAFEQKPIPARSLYKNTAKSSAIDPASPISAALTNKDVIPSTSETSASPKEFTLDQAIQTALNSDPRISAALENVRQAEADLTTAGLIPNPDLSAGGSLIPLDRKFTVDRQGGPPQFDVGVAMPIDWFLFGKRAAAITSGQFGVDAASADFANTIRLRIAGTIKAFYDVLEARAMVELANENQKNLSAMEKIILNRVALGGVGTIEADRIKLSIFASHRELHTQELNLAAALNQLRALLGISDNTNMSVNGTLDIITPKKPISNEEAFKWAEENRPDLTALHHQLEKANANIQLEERKAYPQVTPKIGYTRQFQQQAIGFPDANSWGAGIDVIVPLFDRNQGNIAKAKSVHRQTQHNLQAQLVDLRAEIDQAVKTFTSAYQFITYDDPGQLDAATNVRDKINQAYELGGKTLIEVLDAQRAYLETYKVHISGHSSYWHALYQLNAAIGKDLLH
jgi:cobalt-zinc-cadmium efflux system outer membrane protein